MTHEVGLWARLGCGPQVAAPAPVEGGGGARKKVGRENVAGTSHGSERRTRRVTTSKHKPAPIKAQVEGSGTVLLTIRSTCPGIVVSRR